MNISIVSPINQLGYGIAGLNICKELSKVCKLSLIPIPPIDIYNEEDAEVLKEVIINSKFLDFDAPCIKVWHQNDMTQFAGRGLRIGFPFFELDVFTDYEKHHLNSLDAVFVSSKWAKEVCLHNLTINEDKIFVVPLGVDRTIFNECTKTQSPTDKTIFFNCGKWEIRKGHDVIFQFFNDAFTENDNVELWMMNSNPFLSEDDQNKWNSLYLGSKLGSKIKIIPRAKTQQEVYNIMSQIHCGVFPSRAEGWNLELLELMSCGKHVIATDYSAHSEFCNDSNCYMINVNEKEKAFDGKWFLGQGNWAKITQEAKDQAVKHMRNVYDKHQNNALDTNTAGIETSKIFSWENSARKIIQHVQLLQENRSK